MRGFEYLIHSAFSLCLLVVMILLPLAPVFASEEIPTDVSVAESQEIVESLDEATNSEIIPDDEEVVMPSESEDTTVPNGDAVVDDVLSQDPLGTEIITDTDVVSEVETPATDDLALETELPLGNEAETETEALTSTESEVIVENEVALPSDSEIEIVDESTLEVPETEEVLNENENAPSELSEATTTEEIEVVSVNSVVTDENRFSFAKGECTLVSEETFYCAKAVAEPVVTHNDRVFAAADVEGDKEIYIEKDGVVSPITNNIFEDDAPFYDASSETIVWHRLISGRYQIISFDIETEEETQITNDRFNNMFPNSSNGKIVWQGWVGNDWEIFLLEGSELNMITDNASHDITPSANGTHIIWQSFETGVWQMKVYDIQTKEIDTIEDTDGGSIENPRFVLVYDTKFESGDVETRGYDLVSGKVVPLSSTPAPIPNEIPDPDQTGEKSALVSPQTQLKTKVDGVDDQGGESGDGGIDPTLDTSDIVIPAFVGTSTEIVAGQSDITNAETNDVLVLPVTVDNSSSTIHIDDLIITPYTEPIEEGSISPVEPF